MKLTLPTFALPSLPSPWRPTTQARSTGQILLKEVREERNRGHHQRQLGQPFHQRSHSVRRHPHPDAVLRLLCYFKTLLLGAVTFASDHTVSKISTAWTKNYITGVGIWNFNQIKSCIQKFRTQFEYFSYKKDAALFIVILLCSGNQPPQPSSWEQWVQSLNYVKARRYGREQLLVLNVIWIARPTMKSYIPKSLHPSKVKIYQKDRRKVLYLLFKDKRSSSNANRELW